MLVKCSANADATFTTRFHILFPQFLIDILSFCSYSVDISSPSDRLSVTLTLLLTAVAFKFVVSQSLPTISYLTLLVRWPFE